MKYVWLVYLQILFVIGQFNGKKNWIDKHILICYNKLDKLEVNYIKYHNFDKEQLMSFYTNVSALGNSILFRGISNDGKRFKERIEYHPTLYIPTKEETKFRTLEGKPVGEIQPGTMKECKDFIS